MLRQAVLGQLPIITLRTRDTINVADVIRYTSGKPMIQWDGTTILQKALLFIWGGTALKEPWRLVYEKFTKAGSTLLVINPTNPIPEAFDVGDLITPRDMVFKALTEALSNGPPTPAIKDYVGTLMPALGGLTLKESVEVMRLSAVDNDALTPQSITAIRRQIVPPLQGFSQIDTDLEYYEPPKAWAAFVDSKRDYFLGDYDWRVVPRGALLKGTPGTGKTQGVKYLANRWGVPAYRLAVDFNSKWHGESEQNVAAILAQVKHEAPCVLLMDEIEKMMAKGGDSVQEKIRSQLLWFMQENRSKVFVAMTTNDEKKLPPEMFREGRISASIEFHGLTLFEAMPFAQNVLKTFKVGDPAAAKAAVEKRVKSLFSTTNPELVAHAAINEAVVSTLTEEGLLNPAVKED